MVLEIVTSVRLLQNAKAISPIFVTLFGIVTRVRLVLSRKAEPPMLVTGRPLIMPGMSTAPPGPVYPVMVIVLLLVA